MTWASRLKGVFNIDIETCTECGGPVKVIAFIEDPKMIKQILDHLKHKAETHEPGPLPESGAPPARLQQGLFDWRAQKPMVQIEMLRSHRRGGDLPCRMVGMEPTV